MFTLFSVPFPMPATGKPDAPAMGELLRSRPGRLAELCRRAGELARLQEVLRGGLPGPARDHLLVADFNETSLVLLADSPAWAARLRFQVPELLELARTSGGLPRLQTIRVRATASIPENPASPRRPQRSAAAAQALRQTAGSISDTELRESLLRLSRTLETGSQAPGED
jgi:hypothetical protein